MPGGFGTLVPFESAEALEPRLLIVPLLAFDRRGYRLGYGKGHYDRALARLRAAGPALAVGIAYAGQEVESLPVEAHDIALDLIVTDRETIRPSLT